MNSQDPSSNHCCIPGDVIVGLRGEVYTFASMDINSYTAMELYMINEMYCCPECQNSEFLVVWDTGKKPCPQCGGEMDIDPDGNEILWN